jgi:hypothetical protein
VWMVRGQQMQRREDENGPGAFEGQEEARGLGVMSKDQCS